MARRTHLTSLKQINEINLTPLIDLTFLLLITFIITFPLVEQWVPLNLPKAEAKGVTPDTARTISLDVDKKLYLDERVITLDDLAKEMTAQGKSEADITIMVRADERIQYGEVVKVLKILHDAGITKVALVTRAE